MNYDVVGLGTVVVDHLVLLAQHPTQDAKTNIISDAYQVGGPVPTAQVLLSRFGKRNAFIGSWGDDQYGPMIEQDLKAEHLDLTASRLLPGTRSGYAQVWIDEQAETRTIACYRPEHWLQPHELDTALIQQAKAVHLDGWPQETCLQAAQLARQAGVKVCLDAGSLKPGMSDLISYLNVMNCPRRFITEYLDTDDIHAAGKTLLQQGPEIVTITDGRRGAWLFSSAGSLHCEALPVLSLDTTGAGDVFSGALLYGILEAWPLDRVLKFACVTAALKCERLGNRDALPTLSEIEAILQTKELRLSQSD
ncbi:MAG: carbohydrate kinase family protein [Planctomycetes bacterium]|nr:carbohydrate kinase family protein [Planctomycetota bacterium]MCH9727542.1 carbohydrate kinase family protein [Planctomycetota bacterium]MCH9777478.1 carbohydrate kinase family protein [Planctomycetota bacterium]MCH9791765.1 carbohydrate kinase family protein [Planctomycetota bacterium]